MDWLHTLLTPFMFIEAWIMYGFHSVLTFLGIDNSHGLAWTLSIVGLTLVVRTLLIPLFIRQIKSQRAMQLIQPELMKLQAKYKGKTDQLSRQAMAEEQMALYKKNGSNPFSACLPLLVQMPIFLALFTLLNGLQTMPEDKTIGPINHEIAQLVNHASFLGAPLSASFMNSTDLLVKIIAVVMILVMTASQFFTQRQIMSKNMSDAAMESPFMKQQKYMLYILPVVFAVGGVNFPIGVLIYWVTTNIWTMVQQYIVIRNMPAPGSQAERELNARKAKKLEKKNSKAVQQGTVLPSGGVDGDDVESSDTSSKASGQREQRKKVPRSKRKSES